jgi:hypothetical protein
MNIPSIQDLRFRGHAPPIWRTLALAFALSAAILSVAAPPALALERRSGDSVGVASGQTIDDDLFTSGRAVRIDGTVRGDVLAFAELVTVGGTIDGDLIAAAKQVVIDGAVLGDVRVAGATVTVNGKIDRNVTGAAQLFQLGQGARVGGNVVGAGESISLGGDIGGTLTAAGGDMVLQGRIGRDAELFFESLNAGSSARIGGDLVYHSEGEPNVPAGVVGGEVRRIVHESMRAKMQQATDGVEENVRRQFQLGPDGRPGWREPFAMVWNFMSVAWLVGSAVLGLLLLHLFPRFVAQFLDDLRQRPLPSLGIGALTLICTLPVAFLIALTIVGLPLAGLMTAGYFSGIIVGWLLLAVAVGTILVGLVRREGLGAPSTARRHLGWSFLLGLLVLFAATRIPVAGGLVAFAGTSLGLGALLLALQHTWGRTRSQGPEPLPVM